MAYFSNDTVTWSGSFEQHTVYSPKIHPGFVAWVSAFSYGDGTVGLSFDERIQGNNPDFVAPKLEYSHAASVPVSYCSVEAGSADQQSFRVYLRSADGIHFEETGRCPRSEGSFCNFGFPDGRIIGLDVPRMNETHNGWANCIMVRESTDGGKTWRLVRKLLEGTAPYIWRTRTMSDGTGILIASFFGTPWGQGRDRATRTTSLPDEDGHTKIQTFFMTTTDGIHYSGPHYIMAGLGTHEYDVVETAPGTLLFIGGDVQGSPCGYQEVRRCGDGWVNGTVFPIHSGTPEDVMRNPQGGYVPETIVNDLRYNCLLGYRRNKCFSLSNDKGANWVEIVMDQPYTHLYQPQIMVLPDGRTAMYGHFGGGDSAFGENDMAIGAIVLDPVCAKELPGPTRLVMDRMLSEDRSHYINGYWAQVLSGDDPVSGAQVEFRFQRFWDPDGSVNTNPIENAPICLSGTTDENGMVSVHASMFDGIADIHDAYLVNGVCLSGPNLRGCSGPTMSIMNLTPHRRCGFPRDAHMAGGTLYLAPQFLADFPDAMEALRGAVGDDPRLPEGLLCREAEQRLLDSGVLTRDEAGRLCWIPNVHAPRPLDAVKPMLTGDWYE